MKKLKKIKKDGQRSIEHANRASVVSCGEVEFAGMGTKISVSLRGESQVREWRMDNEATNPGPRVRLLSLDIES